MRRKAWAAVKWKICDVYSFIFLKSCLKSTSGAPFFQVSGLSKPMWLNLQCCADRPPLPHQRCCRASESWIMRAAASYSKKSSIHGERSLSLLIGSAVWNVMKWIHCSQSALNSIVVTTTEIDMKLFSSCNPECCHSHVSWKNNRLLKI